MTEDPLLFYSDITKIIRAQWKKSLCVALGVVFCYFFRESESSLTYLSTASFKEESQAQELGTFFPFKHLFSIHGDSGSKTRGLLLSRGMLARVISDAGLQVVPREVKYKQLTNFIQKWRFELGRPVLLPQTLHFSAVQYSENIPHSFSIICTSKEEYLYRDDVSEVRGTFMTPFTHEGVSFILDPSEIQDFKREYHFTVNPINGCIDGLMKGIDISPNIDDSSIMEFEYIHSDPFQGKRVLRSLMKNYLAFLAEESIRIMNGQLAHLDDRCSHLDEKFQQDLAQVSHFLKEHQMVSAETSAQELSEELKSIEKELKADKENRCFLVSPDFVINAISAPSLLDLTTQLTDFLSRRMSIDLNSLEDEKESVLGKIFGNLAVFQSPASISHQSAALMKQIEKANGFINLGPIDEKKYIQDLISISSDLLLERRIYQKQSRDYAGLDLDHVYMLYQKKCNYRDDCIFKEKNIQTLLKEVNFSNFEQLICAGAFSGYVTPDLLNQATHLFSLRRDTANRTEKEQQRMEKEYHRLYDLIVHHLHEVALRWNNELECAKNSMKELNFTVLDLVNKQILLIKNQIHTQKRALLDGLDSRIRRNEERKNAILSQRELIPDLLMEEKKLKMRSEITKGMIQGLSQLMEGKMIAKTLSSIESRPLNQPYSTFVPIKSKMLLKGSSLAVIIFIGSSFLFVIFHLFQGLPISLERLSYQGFRVGGYLKDREVLRKITKGASGVIALLGQEGPDYSHEVATLLALEGKKTLLIETHFNGLLKPNHAPGLFQYLTKESESFSLCHKEGYDYLPMMGRSLFGVELLRSRRFKELIASYKDQYEVILLYSSAKLSSGEAESLLEVAQSACVTLRGETETILKPYQMWNQGKNRITFVACHDT
ncbi:MAG: hypothetical protein KBC64_05865 [Simkaniaceae bacterium]|nr:hypothetical protein [Simkaniaceae bacterium]